MFKYLSISAILISTLASMPVVNAETKAYAPFPGKIKVRLLSVESIAVVHVSLETWPGFSRNVRISLPNIQTPDIGSLKACEQEMAIQALALTEQFLSEAKSISVQNMLMESSASEDALSNIYTDQGGLIEALKSEGFVRSNTTPIKTPWC